MRQKNSINIAFALSNRFENDDNAIFNLRENSVIVTKVKEKKSSKHVLYREKNAREFLIPCPFALKKCLSFLVTKIFAEVIKIFRIPRNFSLFCSTL
jgi:hypothetical protein